jgi:hypothetical protein
MNPLEQVEQAFLQLSWSIKLKEFLYNIELHKENFDSLQVHSEPAGEFGLPPNQFNTVQDIYIGADNAIHVALGALFIALDRALSEANVPVDTSSKTASGQLRILIYMCRCAFAHNSIAPHWEVRNAFSRTLDLPDLPLRIDLNELKNSHFDIGQIGGYYTLKKIIEEVSKCLAE